MIKYVWFATKLINDRGEFNTVNDINFPADTYVLNNNWHRNVLLNCKSERTNFQTKIIWYLHGYIDIFVVGIA